MTTKLEQAARQAFDVDEAITTLELILKDGAEYGNWPLNKNCEDGLRTITALREALAEQSECKECGVKQAQIDRLMLEYCPDDMTPEQMQEWGNNQRPAEQAEQEPVAFIGQGLKPIVPEDLEKLRKHEPGTATLYDTSLYAAPVRTKDLTDDEVAKAYMECTGGDIIARCRAVIAADRRKNHG